MASTSCPQCAFESPAGMRFCGRCGAALAARCPHCGAEAPPDFRFCGHCGKGLQETPAPAAAERPVYTPKHLADKILKSRSALEGERRQVTVLFADLAGFTSLAEKLDPEEVHRIINGCVERSTAQPGTVVVSEATHRAIEGFFETLDLGRLEVKGHEPVRAWQVVRARGARSRIAVGHERGLTPFVGRERELQALLARFADVEAGRGQVVLVAGHAGSGQAR